MKAGNNVWPAIVIAIGIHRRRGSSTRAGLPVPADHGDRAVSSGRRQRCGGAHRHQPDVQNLGQSFIIENVGGAGGTIGSARAAAAAPDGYTLLAAAMGSHVAAPVLTPNVKYDPLLDFVPIGITAHSPAVVIARKDFPAKDLKEFVAVLRQQGGAVKEAHGGIGASSHMACLLFTAEIGAQADPRRLSRVRSGLERSGGRPCRLPVRAVGQRGRPVLAGSVKAYAVSAGERLATLPGVPTAKEAGVNYEMSVWSGLFAPKGAPPEVIAKLADALDKALDDPVVRETLAKLGGSIPAKAERTPAAFDRFVRSEMARWAPILAAAGAESNAMATGSAGTRR